MLQQVEQTDLMTYGLIPEFVGRFPIITALHVSALPKALYIATHVMKLTHKCFAVDTAHKSGWQI